MGRTIYFFGCEGAGAGTDGAGAVAGATGAGAGRGTDGAGLSQVLISPGVAILFGIRGYS